MLSSTWERRFSVSGSTPTSMTELTLAGEVIMPKLSARRVNASTAASLSKRGQDPVGRLIVRSTSWVTRKPRRWICPWPR